MGAMGVIISMVCYVNVSIRNKGGRELVQDRGEGHLKTWEPGCGLDGM